MCDRKYMFGDKSRFGSSLNGQLKHVQKMVNKKKYFFVH